MQKGWNEIVVTRIALAIYVEPGTGKSTHRDRPLHGLVLNDEGSVKEYYFSNGRVMRTEGGELFYLPKGSTYRVKDFGAGGCYAINFDAAITDEPFSMKFRSTEAVLKSFKTAVREWRKPSGFQGIAVMRSLYDIIYQMQLEATRPYVPDTRLAVIAPAVERISACFTENGLSVAELAAICGISEAYLRRLFLEAFGVSPKEYMIGMRMEYARRLLESGQLSVGEIANLCGYAEPCHFSREFAKRVGMPPNEYKSTRR